MRVSKIIIIGWTILMAISFFQGMWLLAAKHHGEVSDAEAYAVLFGLIFHCLLWGLIVVPTALIGLLFRKPQLPVKTVHEMGCDAVARELGV